MRRTKQTPGATRPETPPLLIQQQCPKPSNPKQKRETKKKYIKINKWAMNKSRLGDRRKSVIQVTRSKDMYVTLPHAAHHPPPQHSRAARPHAQGARTAAAARTWARLPRLPLRRRAAGQQSETQRRHHGCGRRPGPGAARGGGGGKHTHGGSQCAGHDALRAARPPALCGQAARVCCGWAALAPVTKACSEPSLPSRCSPYCGLSLGPVLSKKPCVTWAEYVRSWFKITYILLNIRSNGFLESKSCELPWSSQCRRSRPLPSNTQGHQTGRERCVLPGCARMLDGRATAA